MEEDILNNNGMEEYIRKIFIAPNAAIKVACFKAGMTEEDYYNTLGECRMYGDNKGIVPEDIQTDTGRRGRRYQQVERRRCKSYELRGLCNFSIGRITS